MQPQSIDTFTPSRIFCEEARGNVTLPIYTIEDLKPRLRGSVFKGNVTDK